MIEEDDICIKGTIEVQRLTYCHNEWCRFSQSSYCDCEMWVGMLAVLFWWPGAQTQVTGTPWKCNMKEVTKAIYLQKNGGGIEKIRGPFDIAKHWQQASNTKHQAHTCEDTIVEITDLSQMKKETSKQFIWYVKLVLELSAFVASNQQQNDVEMFCT